ncbi:hypothetical protein [Desulfosediminicola sp.]|uniref:hypothetical protein n=1 Tax=Desulfosediminicola sp. TaxID=2886825 RepID=UPI003AF2765B
MANASNVMEERFHKTMKSKAALDAAAAVKQYHSLITAGYSPKDAFLVAFLGIHLLSIPGVKPLPEPDPPYFTLSSLYNAVKEAHANVNLLKKEIEVQLDYLERCINREKT